MLELSNEVNKFLLNSSKPITQSKDARISYNSQEISFEYHANKKLCNFLSFIAHMKE